jgi:hypothetical protein
MVFVSSLKSEDESMICFFGFNIDGLDESSPYRIDYYTRGY